MSFIDKIENKEVKEWLRKEKNQDILEGLVLKHEKRGYKLDFQSGLLLKSFYSEEITQKLNRTRCGVIFLRPSDYHLHEEMDEVIKVLGGGGLLIMGEEPYMKIPLFLNDKPVYIENKIPHAFSPMPEYPYLEIEVDCTKIYDKTEEETITRFDEFPPWKKLFKR